MEIFNLEASGDVCLEPDPHENACPCRLSSMFAAEAMHTTIFGFRRNLWDSTLAVNFPNGLARTGGLLFRSLNAASQLVSFVNL